MVTKLNKKKVKQLKKQVNELKRKLQKMEIRPCQGDADLKEREKDVKALKDQIFSLENESDRYLYSRWENE